MDVRSKQFEIKHLEYFLQLCSFDLNFVKSLK